jgi:hypothetical protein
VNNRALPIPAGGVAGPVTIVPDPLGEVILNAHPSILLGVTTTAVATAVQPHTNISNAATKSAFRFIVMFSPLPAGKMG